MKILLPGFLLAVFLISGTQAEKDDCLTVDVGDYLDRVLEQAREELPDPIRLPPRSSIVELSDGLLWGLSNLSRMGVADVSCHDDRITIKGKLTTDELKGRYTWTKPRGPRKSDYQGYVVLISNDFEADVEIAIDLVDGEKHHPRLAKFQIDRLKGARVEMTGLGFFTWALAEVTTLMSGIFQRAIASSIQGPIKEALERQMREISLD